MSHNNKKNKFKPPPLQSCDSSTSPSTSYPSSPTGRHGNLAYLASRRNSGTNASSSGAGTRRQSSNFLELPATDYYSRRRNRVSSVPSSSNVSYSELYRLRSFNIHNNRVVNCGDSFVSSSCSLQASPISSSNSSLCNNLCYRVVLLGHTSVGKSALVRQFMTSEYINTYDASLDDEFGEKTVSVMLDGVESELTFIDHPCVEMSPENSLSTYNPQGVIVVYSITDKSSFNFAADILRYLWQEGITQEKAVILVANKCDLERAREVSMQEGKTLATSHDSKFIETSSGIQHNVDELLVGILKQCRLRDHSNNSSSKRSKNSSTFSIHDLAKELIFCLTKKRVYLEKSKSCQNLHVL